MPGKIVGFDNDGRVVPAQYGLASATITYTTNDVDAGVIDVRTGSTLLLAAIGTFDVSAVTAFMGRTGVAMAVSGPVGVTPYAVIQWAGDGGSYDDGWNPNGYRNHNYNMQHQIAIVCNYVLRLPLVPAIASAEALVEDSWADSVTTFNAMGSLPMATVTMRTPMTFAAGTQTDQATRFVNQVATVAEVLAAGDWHVDVETGVISVYKATAGFGAGNLYTVVYSNYASAPTGSSVSRFACALGDLQPGDFVKCNADSNWVKATPSVVGGTTNGDGIREIMGQVLEVKNVLGLDALDKVRTAYSPALNTDASGSFPGYLGQMDQMPGSANGGMPADAHYAGAADLIVTVNLISR
jgi:hypothetical protein